MKRNKKPCSMLQQRQRELAWALYITEGAAANLAHALAVNCVTFEPADAAALQKAIDAHDRAAQHIRRRLAAL